jgi:hypothetical protein
MKAVFNHIHMAQDVLEQSEAWTSFINSNVSRSQIPRGHEPHSIKWNGERKTGSCSGISPEEEDPESEWMQEFSLWINWKEVDYDGFVVSRVWTSIEHNPRAQTTCHQEK